MQIFLGLLFFFLDFTFDKIDLIPDFVGYIFIFIGLRSISSLSLNFIYAKITAILLIFLSLFKDFPILTPLKQVSSNTGNPTDLNSLFSLTKEKGFIPLLLITVVSVILEFILLWNICEGISKVATESGNKNLAKTAEKRRNLYAVLGVLYIGVGLSFLSFYTGLLPAYFITQMSYLIVFLVVYNFVVICLVMDLIRKASLEIK
jgi:hypothetical protein